MSEQYNVVNKQNRIVKNGSGLSLDDAKERALKFASDNGYQPKVVPVERVAVARPTIEPQPAPAVEPTGVATIAVAEARITCRMARYIWRHQRAIVDKTVRARNGEEMEKYHWSGVVSMAINNAEITGGRLEFLEKLFKQVKSAVDTHEALGTSYTILNPDKAKFYFGK